MATVGAEILVKLRAEGGNQVQSEMGKAEKAATGLDGKIGKLGKSLTGTAALGAVQFVGLTGPILGVGVATVKAASDQNEAISKVNVVFGDNAKEIESWSNTAATSFGLTKTQALDATGTFGNLFTSMGFSSDQASQMSRDFVGLSADLGSFNNVPTPEALAAINAGLIGEYEPLRRFGVLLTEDAVKNKALEMGIWDGTGALTEQQKVLARQELIMEQTTNAQGDFARTSDGLANSTRILKAMLGDLAADVGQMLLPAFQKGVGMLIGLVGKISSLPGPIKGAIVGFGLFLAALGPILIIISAMLPAIGMLGTAFGVLAGLVSAPVLAIIAVLALLAIAYKTNFLGFGDAVRAVGSAIKGGLTSALNVVKQFVSGFKSAFKALEGNPLAKVFKAISAGLKAIGGDNTPRWLVDVANGFQKLGDIVQAAADIFNRFRSQGMNPVNAALATLRAMIPGLTAVINPLLVAVGALQNAFGALKDGDFGRVFDNLKTAGLAAFQALGAAISGFGQLLISGFQAIPWGDLWDGLVDSVEAIEFGEIGRSVARRVMDGLRAAGSAAGNLWGWLTQSLSSAFDSVRTAVGEGIRLAWDKIQDIDWGSFIPDLNWSAIIQGAIDIASWLADKVSDLPWRSLITGTVAIAEWLADKISSIPWRSIITGTIAVAEWLADKISSIPWRSIITGTIAVAEWLADKVSSIPWRSIITGTIEIATWLADKVSSIPWRSIISGTIEIAEWLADKVSSIPWRSIIAGTIEVTEWLADKVGSIPWRSIITGTVAIAEWLGDKIGSIPWRSIITGTIKIVDWLGDKIGSIPWRSIVTGTIRIADWLADKVGSIPWRSIVTGTIDVVTWLADKIGSVPWKDFITGMFDWASVTASDIVGSIPWPDIPSFSWPSISAQDIMNFVFGESKTGNFENPDGVKDNPATPANPGGDDSGDIQLGLSGRGNLFGSGGGGIGPQIKAAMDAAKQAVNTGLDDIRATFTTRVPEWNTETQTQMLGMPPAVAAALGAINPVASVAIGAVGATLGAGAALAAANVGANFGQVPAFAATHFGSMSAITALQTAMAATSVATNTNAAAVSAGANFGRMSASGISQTAAMAAGVASTVTTLGATIGSRVATMASTATSSFNNLKSNATSAIQSMGSSVGSAISTMQSQSSIKIGAMQLGASVAMAAMKSNSISAATSTSSGVISAFSVMGAGVRNATSSAFGAISGIIASSGGSAIGTARSIGAAIGQGVAAGINGAAGAVAAAAANIISIANSAMNAAAAIRSPSKLTAIVGKFLTLGVAAGMTAYSALQGLRSNAGAVIDTVQSALAAGSATMPLGTSNLPYRYQRPLPVPASRIGHSGASGGNVYVVMTRSELEDLFATVDTVKVLTNPQEIAATFGSR